jgi:hypothetical protein
MHTTTAYRTVGVMNNSLSTMALNDSLIINIFIINTFNLRMDLDINKIIIYSQADMNIFSTPFCYALPPTSKHRLSKNKGDAFRS